MKLASPRSLSVSNRSVIPTVAATGLRAPGMKLCFSSLFVRFEQKCHPDRSEAKWRDLLFTLRIIKPGWKRYPPPCHPDRSGA
jgi:hypothetical protein